MENPRSAFKIGRKRKALGWTFLTIGMLVAGVWLASVFAGASRSDGRGSFSIGGGIIHYSATPGTPSNPGWSFRWYGPSKARWRWVTEPLDDVLWVTAWNYRLVAKQESNVLPGRTPFGFQSWSAVIWPIPLLFWTPAVLLLRSGLLARRRAITGGCAKCGYSLAGLAADAPCPECGKGSKVTA